MCTCVHACVCACMCMHVCVCTCACMCALLKALALRVTMMVHTLVTWSCVRGEHSPCKQASTNHSHFNMAPLTALHTPCWQDDPLDSCTPMDPHPAPCPSQHTMHSSSPSHVQLESPMVSHRGTHWVLRASVSLTGSKHRPLAHHSTVNSCQLAMLTHLMQQVPLAAGSGVDGQVMFTPLH